MKKIMLVFALALGVFFLIPERSEAQTGCTHIGSGCLHVVESISCYSDSACSNSCPYGRQCCQTNWGYCLEGTKNIAYYKFCNDFCEATGGPGEW